MKDLWRGEVTRKHSLPLDRETHVLNKHFNTDESETCISSLLDSEPFEFTIRSKGFVGSLESEQLEEDPISLILNHYRQKREMASIVGNYQHKYNENLNEYFAAVGVPYIPRKMMCMSRPQLEIENNGDKWTIRTISLFRTLESTFSLGEEYEEQMAPGVTLKNTTTKEGESLVTVSVGPGNNKVIRQYEVTEDGVVLTMTHESSGQVAKRYFQRIE